MSPIVTNQHIDALAILRSHGRSFYFASHLLSKRHRNRAARLYAVCRQIDDLADEAQDQRYAKTALHALKQSILQQQPIDRLAYQATELCRDMAIEAPLLDLINGVASDLEDVRVQNQSELQHYAYQVAGTVGLMMCEALDVSDPEAHPYAIDLGIAMQLTNIARDLAEDAQNNRVYFPADWIGTMSPEQILNPNQDQQLCLQQATKKLLDLADNYYQRGLLGLPYLPGRAAYGILVAASVYREIGEEIKKADYQAWRFRAKVSWLKKIGCAFDAISRYAIKKQPKFIKNT
ncbi:phytoene/squalene synthase family protein [Thiomicrospira cyclica]|uniref:Phytoene synthase n=1 Tax=Thiomicrospira cyclica (strain DSM 14477 / JCM 11371 / ALM1) TaxID=717773 RepID=F6DAK8_THICA|nr:phytoene/squalene synthase family protein [Thiomicrospira cyclica]AEG32264.1 Phytoene synthase [Thiomicrospira cyclica ALM1]